MFLRVMFLFRENAKTLRLDALIEKERVYIFTSSRVMLECWPFYKVLNSKPIHKWTPQKIPVGHEVTFQI
jgi:hypothetical protein